MPGRRYPPPPKAAGVILDDPFTSTRGKAAADFKRQVRTKLLELHEEGVTLGAIRSLSNGQLTDNAILDILEARKVPVATYRILDDVLKKIQK